MRQLVGNDIGDDWLESPHSMLAIHQGSLTALELSAANGCHFCAMIWGSLFITSHHPPINDIHKWNKGAPRIVLRRDWRIDWTVSDSRSLSMGSR